MTSSFPSKSHPRRLLNLSKSNEATGDITKYNVKSSRLLQLPSEVRNRIYHFSLGGRDVHVNLRNDANWLFVCQASKPEDEVFEEYRTTKTAPNYLIQHRDCEPAVTHHSLKDAISFSLLRVCRTVYSEAALIPFAANKFIIRDLTRLQSFCLSVMPVQQRAVQDLEFVSTLSAQWPITDTRFRFRDYTGLRHVRVRIEFGIDQENDGYTKTFDALDKFAQSQLVSASVITHRIDGGATLLHTQNWATDLAAKLMSTRKRDEAAATKKAHQQNRANIRSSRGLRSLKG